MIGTLGESLEQEYGSVVTRLFRVFKPHPDSKIRYIYIYIYI